MHRLRETDVTPEAPRPSRSGLYAVLLVSLTLAVGAAMAALAADANKPAPPPKASAGDNAAVATFASGCFWCTEADFDKVDGVLETISGYTGGTTENPTYQSIGTGRTGHYEALQVKFDPAKVSYERLLAWYWRHVDPVDGDGQFCDRGSQYRPAIFVHDATQRRLAEASRDALAKNGPFDRPIAVAILDARTFTPAEDYHQDYYQKNPLRYRVYRHGCGRDQRIEQIWSKTTG